MQDPIGQPGNRPSDDLVRGAQFENQERDGNILGGIIGGLIAAALGAAAWAIITMLTEYQTTLMALGVGAITGFGVRLAGRGRSIIFGIVGGVLALVGVFAGNFGTIYLLIQREFGADAATLLTIQDYLEIMQETLEPIDFAFFGLAILAGFAFARVTDRNTPKPQAAL